VMLYVVLFYVLMFYSCGVRCVIGLVVVMRLWVCICVVSSDWWVLWNVVLVMVMVVCLCSVWVNVLGLMWVSRLCEFDGGVVLRWMLVSLVVGLRWWVFGLCGWFIVMCVR